MDEMHNSFGRLSTQAPEWKPQSLIQQEKNVVVESDLHPGKEFIPGQGWSSATTTTNGEIYCFSCVNEMKQAQT
jgi:hypothetical protein